MNRTQTLDRLAGPDTSTETFLWAFFLAIAVDVTIGRCCGDRRCETARSCDLADWLEKMAQLQTGGGEA